MSFYVTLPSDSSSLYYKDNTISKFKTYLPKPLRFDGAYEVGLAEISFPRTWYNVRKNNFKYINDKVSLSRIVQIPAGYYSNVEDLLNVMGAYEHLDKVKFTHLQYPNLVKIVLPENIKVTLGPDLAILLGFSDNRGDDVEISKSMTAPHSVDMDAGLHALYVYSDLVERTIVGDQMVPLLRMISVEGESVSYGKTVTKIFDRPHYLPVVSNNVKTIEINIMDDLGEPIQFQRGKAHVTLHFRPRKTWTSL